MPTIKGNQIAAARALLGWDQKTLAEQIGLSVAAISKIEKGDNKGKAATLSKIEKAFEYAGIEFTEGEGVKKKRISVSHYEGHEGFSNFLDDVYFTASKVGGEICISNVDARYWIKWAGEEKWAAHTERMTKIKHLIDDKIIIKEDDWFFPADGFAEYRWFPKELFDDQTLYAYGDKLAFINFTEDNVHIYVLPHARFAKGFRVLFNIAWDRVAVKPYEKK